MSGKGRTATIIVSYLMYKMLSDDFNKWEKDIKIIKQNLKNYVIGYKIKDILDKLIFLNI